MIEPSVALYDQGAERTASAFRYFDTQLKALHKDFADFDALVRC